MIKYQILHPEMKTIVSSLINERDQIQQEMNYYKSCSNQNDQQSWDMKKLLEPLDLLSNLGKETIKKLVPFSPIDPYYGPTFNQECIKVIPCSLGLLKCEGNEQQVEQTHIS